MTTAIQSADWDALSSELSGIEIIRDRASVAKLSQDYYHFSLYHLSKSMLQPTSLLKSLIFCG